MQWLPDNWKPKVVAVDIDGTLTNENKLIEPSVIDALQRLENGRNTSNISYWKC